MSCQMEFSTEKLLFFSTLQRHDVSWFGEFEEYLKRFFGTIFKHGENIMNEQHKKIDD